MPTLGGWEWIFILLCLGCFAVLVILSVAKLMVRGSDQEKGKMK